MPIKNYRTEVPAIRSVAEIQQMLTSHGATAIAIRNEGKEPTEIAFDLPAGDGEQTYRLWANVEGVHRTMQRQSADGKVPRHLVTRDHAKRVAWRILRDWVAAQLAIVEAGAAEADQVFLAWAQVRGRSVYDVLMDQGLLALPEPREGAQ